jgi:hypothetical protein
VRVRLSPPVVKEPTAHVLQLLAPASLYMASAPQAVCLPLPSHDEPSEHAEHEVRVADVPPAVNEPGAHVAQLLAPASLYMAAPQAVSALLPSHDEPPGHAEHEVRVADVPPAVNEPGAHVAQLLAPALL